MTPERDQTCTYTAAGVRCPATATHYTLVDPARPFAWMVWEGPRPTAEGLGGMVRIWKVVRAEFCLRHAEEVAQSRTTRAVPRSGEQR